MAGTVIEALRIGITYTEKLSSLKNSQCTQVEWRRNTLEDRAVLRTAIVQAEAATEVLVALKLLVADVADYAAWQRPCHALDVAVAAIAKAEGRA